INIAAIGIAISVLWKKRTTNSHAFIRNPVDNITGAVSTKKIICTIEITVMKYLAPISTVSIESAIINTGKNISAIPIIIAGATIIALGICNKLSSGTKTIPIISKNDVYSAI